MRFRDLFHATVDRPAEPPPGGAGPPPPRELFRQAADLIAAGDEAITRALSADSEKFLAANRQEGGQ